MRGYSSIVKPIGKEEFLFTFSKGDARIFEDILRQAEGEIFVRIFKEEDTRIMIRVSDSHANKNSSFPIAFNNIKFREKDTPLRSVRGSEHQLGRDLERGTFGAPFVLTHILPKAFLTINNVFCLRRVR